MTEEEITVELPRVNLEEQQPKKGNSLILKYISLFIDFMCMLLISIWYYTTSETKDLSVYVSVSIAILSILMLYKAITKEPRRIIVINWIIYLYIIILCAIVLKNKEPYLFTVVVVFMTLGLLLIYYFATRKKYIKISEGHLKSTLD